MKNLLITIVLNLLLLNILSAQNGKFVAGAFLHKVDCESGKAFIDLKIKAYDNDTHFHLAEQNYRLSFNRSAFAPGSAQIERELDISGVIEMPDDTTIYSNHTLLGSSDTLISYNIELLYGEGYLLTPDEWTSVGRISLDVVDTNECFTIQLHDSGTFPPTYIGEFWGGTFHIVNEGVHMELEDCLSDYCESEEEDEVAVSVEQTADLQLNIEVLPTVVRDELTIRYDLPTQLDLTQIVIVDMHGRTWQQHQKTLTEQDAFKFNVSHLPQGIYLINTLIDGQWISRKFVKI